MKIMVAGPRELGTKQFEVSLLIDAYFSQEADPTQPPVRVIHGAARGVDAMAAEAARRHGFVVEPFPVAINDRRKAREERGDESKAPLYRTMRMLDLEQPDLVVAWWDGKSPGTGFTIAQAQMRGIPVEIHPI